MFFIINIFLRMKPNFQKHVKAIDTLKQTLKEIQEGG